MIVAETDSDSKKYGRSLIEKGNTKVGKMVLRNSKCSKTSKIKQQ